MTATHESPARSTRTPGAARTGRALPFAQPLLDEREQEAVRQVLAGPTLTHGPRVRQFESDFAAFVGDGHAVATSSCMAALHLACLALGIGPGDEVLVSAQTHTATAHAVELTGARCVFVDSEPRTGNLDLDLLAERITPATRAIALVHYLGVCVDMPRVLQFAQQNNLRVIEDCALALGSTCGATHAGLWGDFGCFSFYPAKHITTGEGGMLVTRDPALAQRVSSLRAFGIDRHIVDQRALPGLYDVADLGLNYRMSEIAAAIGIVQLAKLPEFLRIRRRNFTRLAAGLEGLAGVRVLAADQAVQHSSCYCLVALLEAPLAARRSELLGRLNAAGVGTSLYYPAPVPRMTYYRQKYATPVAHMLQAARISDTSIALPVGPHLTDEDMDTMAACLCSAIEELAT